MFLKLGITVWLGLVLVGLWKINQYSNTPGESARASQRLPSISGVAVSSGLATLVLFLHPKCGCSKATLGELAQLVPKISAKSKVNIVFLKPDGFTDADVRGSLWAEANEIKNQHASRIIQKCLP